MPCRLKFTFVYANLVYGLSVRGLVCVCVGVCVFAVQNAVEAFQFGVVRAVDGLWGRDFECGLRFSRCLCKIRLKAFGVANWDVGF